jgi:hypothetical protein
VTPPHWTEQVCGYPFTVVGGGGFAESCDINGVPGRGRMWIPRTFRGGIYVDDLLRQL